MTFWAFVGVFSAIILTELAMRRLSIAEESGLLIVASFVCAQHLPTGPPHVD